MPEAISLMRCEVGVASSRRRRGWERGVVWTAKLMRPLRWPKKVMVRRREGEEVRGRRERREGRRERRKEGELAVDMRRMAGMDSGREELRRRWRGEAEELEDDEEEG